MKIFRVCLLFLIGATSAIAAEWKGITPLHSTKADVLRILGTSAIDKDGQTYYSGPDAIAVISYQTETCDSNSVKFGFGWNVPTGTVSIIGVIPKEKFGKERIDASLTKDKNSDGIYEYYSSPTGLRVETLDGIVSLVTYKATGLEDEEFHCPMVQKCCWDVFPKIDEFEPTNKANTKGRVSYLLYDIERMGGRGVIVVSGPNKTIRQRRIASLAQQLAPIFKKIKLEPQRISIVDGGYRSSEYITFSEYPIASEINWVWIPREPDPPVDLKKPLPRKPKPVTKSCRTSRTPNPSQTV
jgi:hypothetical protein